MSAKYIPLMEVVSQFLDENDKSIGDEDKAWGIAFRGLELMHFNTAAEPKTVLLPVLSNKTANFPADYVGWCKVGVLNERGELVTLIVNESLTTYASDNQNRLSRISGEVNSGIDDVYYINYWDGGGYSPLKGVGYGLENFGECRVDERNNVVILDKSFRYSNIAFEYICCPQKDYDYKIDRRLREPVINFMNWKFKLGSRADFYASYVEGDRMMHPFNVQHFQQVLRDGNKFCVKL